MIEPKADKIGKNGGHKYLHFNREGPYWTTEHDSALRFSRYRDAQQIVDFLSGEYSIVAEAIEHGWIDRELNG